MLVRLRDYLRERQIAEAKASLLAATTFEERRACAAQMRALITQRSPERVAQMEEERGIA